MSRFLALACLLCAACAPIQRSERIAADGSLALTQVSVIDVERGRVLPNQTVLIAANRIRAVGPSHQVRVRPGAHVVDARGKYLIPGLVDTHVHATLSQADPVPLPMFGWFLANGVTTVRDASGAGREQRFVEVREQAERGEILFPRFYVSGSASVPNIGRHGAADMRDLTRRLIGLGVDGIKIIHVTREEALVVLEEAQKADIPVYGHTYAARAVRADLGVRYDNYTPELVRAGLSGVMHIDGASPSPASSSQPSPEEHDSSDEMSVDMLSRWLHATDSEVQELVDVMVGSGAWLEPTLIAFDVYANPGRYREHRGEPIAGLSVWEYVGFTEAILQEGSPRRRWPAMMERAMDFVRRFHEAGGMVIAGSDGAPLYGWGTHDEMRMLVEAGLSPMAALQAATINAARALRWDSRIGTIEEGKLADLVLLAANPLEDIAHVQNIHAVVLNGRYLDRQALDELLKPVERAAQAPAR